MQCDKAVKTIHDFTYKCIYSVYLFSNDKHVFYKLYVSMFVSARATWRYLAAINRPRTASIDDEARFIFSKQQLLTDQSTEH